jgi:predicted DNA binding protein
MGVVLEFTISGETFAVGRALGSRPGAHIELERIVPTGDDYAPFFWVDGDGEESSLRDSVEASEHVENLTVLDTVGDRTLYRVTWTGEGEAFLKGIADSGGTVLEGKANGDWSFRVRFADRSDVAGFYDYCEAEGFDIGVDRVYPLTEETREEELPDVSDEQRKALLLALERGYFGDSRNVTTAELAEELGISQQAFSERLRRGNEAALQYMLLDE